MNKQENETWNTEKFHQFVEAITTGGTSSAVWCKYLANNPSGDSRVLPYLENALEDSTICVISVPPTYGEVRFEAAYALATERKQQGIKEFFVLSQTFMPLSVEKAMQIILPNSSMMSRKVRLKGIEAELTFLREKGLLELTDYGFGED